MYGFNKLDYNMLRLRDIKLVESISSLDNIPEGKTLINTINAYSYTVTRKDRIFAEALTEGDYLIPDGSSIVKACRYINAKSRPLERVAGWDLFMHEMRRVNKMSTHDCHKKVMFMGSSERVLELIRAKAADEYPHLDIITYSPPFKAVFSTEENDAIIEAINDAKPDLLWIGMTAPKQEKWTYANWQRLDISCHVGTIGAVFDFYAGTARRAPLWWQEHSIEWLYRLISEPRRMWRRYIIGNTKFLWYMIQEKSGNSSCP